MAILNQTQLVAASNATYIDNTSGSITPTAVRTFNDSFISSSIVASVTSSMTVASASFAGTASFALNFNPSATASYALQALNANNATNATNADTATFANTANTANSANTAVSSNTAISASFASTASFALNFNPSATASYALFAVTASYALNVPTSSVSASYALTASKISILDDNGNTNHKVTFVNTAVASGGEQILIDPTTTQFTYNPSTNLLVVTASLAQVAVSASRAISAANADNATTASYASNAELLDNLNFTAFVLTSSFSPFSSSIAGRVTTLETAGYATLAGNNTFTGNNIFGNVTASNALITSASVLNLTVIYQTASIIYSSGSNQFGDAANDVQTLWGTVDIKSGPLLVTGSVNSLGGFTGSLLGTASTASFVTTAQTASFVTLAQTASFVTLAQTASYVLNAVSASFALNAVTASYVLNAVNATTAATASSVSTLVQPVIVSGSLRGSVVSASIASNTSSIDFSLGNFFTSLVSGSTNFNITNPRPGQTVNLLLSTVGVASASFSSNVRQVSGSLYTPTSGSGRNDILTFISWDGSSVYLANVKNLI